MIVKVSSKGQVVIPNEIREKMKIKAGVFLEFRQIDDKRLEVTVIKDPVEELHGILKGTNALQELEEEHRKEIEEDEILARRMGGTRMAPRRKRSS
ncbi:MAG TPA: AbrB/MazE/SpoVT family DNA-binding domain-containing protein [Thermodesulfobacteriota bacterium]|nr:AbrB/MazE/SpoVT family DNA-binding domain-containing protein [Thermodesulfobacteriota bacterium]